MPKYPFYILLAAIALWLLQLFPITGIFLMFAGGMFLPGLLLYAFFISVTLEAMRGRLPRVLVALPVIVIGAYYAAYLMQAVNIASLQEDLRQTNPGQVIHFDPALHALVDEYISPASHDIPVVYKANAILPEGYRAKFIADLSLCDSIGRKGRVHFQQLGSDQCLLEVPKRPSGAILRVEREFPRRDPGEQITRLYVDDVLKATYRAVTVKKLKPIPFFIAGCGLNSAAAKWECFHEFASTLLKLDVLDRREDRRTAPVALMLGLNQIPFRGPYTVRPENSALVSLAVNDAAATEMREMRAFDDMLRGNPSEVPREMQNTVIKYPTSLSSRADAIADRFSQVMQAQADPVVGCLKLAMPASDDGARRLAVTRPAQSINEDRMRAIIRDPKSDERSKRWAAATLALAAVERGGMTATQRALYNDCRKAHRATADRNSEMELRVLTRALTAMPDEDFAKVASRVQKVFLLPAEMPEYYSSLYVRSGVAGPNAAQMYKTDLTTNLFPTPRYPALGLCRSGADKETLALLEKAFVSLRKTGFEATDRQAIALVLIKHGRSDYVRAHLPEMHPTAKAWYDMLLSGQGWNAIGPNNCAVAHPNSPTDVMGPRLESPANGNWQVRDR